MGTPGETLVRKSVALPADLRAFLTEVAGMIERGEYEAVVPSDDLLQGDGVYGGRISEGGDVWGFTYWPTDDWHPKWELLFTREELRRIAAGEAREVALWFCREDGCGYAYSLADARWEHPGVWRGSGRSRG